MGRCRMNPKPHFPTNTLDAAQPWICGDCQAEFPTRKGYILHDLECHDGLERARRCHLADLDDYEVLAATRQHPLDPTRCPSCGAGEGHLYEFLVEHDPAHPDQLTQHRACMECRACWVERYQLLSIEIQERR
jgi:hypothetical protein